MITAITLVIFGVIVCYVSLVHGNKADKLTKTGIQTEGIIFDFETDGNSRSDDTRGYPVIRFVTEKQEWITKRSDISVSNQQQGDKVTVTYNPENPEEFITGNITSAKILTAIFSAAGIIAAFAGFYLLLKELTVL